MKPFTLMDIQDRLHELVGADSTDERAVIRQQLLDVATEHFVRFGYRKANIGDIARAAGVGKGTVYLYFDSKKTLLMAVVAREKLHWLPKMSEVMNLPPSQKVSSYIRMSLELVQRSPLMRKLLQRDPELERVVRAYRASHEEEAEATVAFVSNLLGDSLAHLPPDERVQRVRTLHVSLQAASYSMDQLGLAGLDADAFVQTYTHILAQGLVAP